MATSAFLITSSAIVFASLLMSSVHGATKDDAYSLHFDLFSVYNKKVRPLSNNSNVDVDIAFAPLSLVDVAEKEQKLVTYARMELYWQDTYLSWDPDNYGGLESFLVRQDDIWLPDIVVGNSVTSQSQLGFKELLLRLWDDGYIQWEPSFIIQTSCDIDITFYPFDTQICNIDFETAMSDANEVTVYINKTQPVIMDDFSEDGQWELLGISARNENKTNGKTRIRFSLLLKRRTTFYIVNIIVPVMMLSIVSTLVFALPADAGEKMGMGITVLLAYAVYLTIVSDHLPSTSKQISLLALYLTILLGVTAFSILVEVFILRLHHKPESELVGSKTARFSLCLRAVTCSSSRRTEARRPQKNSHAQNNFVLNGDPTRYMTRPDFHPTPDYEFITWPEVAASLDWFCFVLFTTLNIMTTVAFIVALVVGAAKNNPTLPPNYTYTDEF